MSDVKLVQSAPLLPPELERKIFEIAAHARLSVIPTLVLVAWRVKEWVEPLLYQTIVLPSDFWTSSDIRPPGHPEYERGTLSHILETKSSCLLAQAVHNLYLFKIDTGEDLLARVLAACSATVNLWIIVRGLNARRHLLSLLEESNLRLRRLHCYVGDLFGDIEPDFTRPVFANITHLEILELNETELWFSSIDSLLTITTGMPGLTHLAFCCTLFINAWLPLLRGCPKLRVLLLLEPSRGNQDNFAAHRDAAELAKDVRFVMMWFSEPMWACEECRMWQISARAQGQDHWDMVEDFVESRRVGKADELEYRCHL